MPSDKDVETAPGNSLFSCKQCGECCIGYGGTYVTDHDIERIAAYTGTDPHEFVEQFCNLSGDKPVLAQQDDGHCVFWDKICTIHHVKPQMCRKWPYIENLLIDFENWNIMASMCPGMKKDVSSRVVKDWVKKMISCTGS